VNIFAAAAPAALLAAVLTPSQILSNPSSYEGQNVTVSGTISNIQVNKSMFRTVTGFQLCDTKCVVVIDEKNASHKNGEQATVSGTFQQSFKGPKRSFTNVVLIH
jgi:cytochrome c-type biogenesis protein CcmE